MAQQNQHIINKHIFHLKVKQREEASLLRQQMQELFWKDVLPALEKVLDDFVPKDELWTIDRLEIDLGGIPKAVLLEELVKRFLQAFKEQFEKQALKAPVDFQLEKHNLEDGQFHLWVYFLEHGALPPNMAIPEETSWNTSILKVLASKVQAIETLRQLIAQKPFVLDRIVFQRSTAFLINLLEAFSGKTQKALQYVEDVLQAFFTNKELFENRNRSISAEASEAQIHRFWKLISEEVIKNRLKEDTVKLLELVLPKLWPVQVLAVFRRFVKKKLKVELGEKNTILIALDKVLDEIVVDNEHLKAEEEWGETEKRPQSEDLMFSARDQVSVSQLDDSDENFSQKDLVETKRGPESKESLLDNQDEEISKKKASSSEEIPFNKFVEKPGVSEAGDELNLEEDDINTLSSEKSLDQLNDSGEKASPDEFIEESVEKKIGKHAEQNEISGANRDAASTKHDDLGSPGSNISNRDDQGKTKASEKNEEELHRPPKRALGEEFVKDPSQHQDQQDSEDEENIIKEKWTFFETSLKRPPFVESGPEYYQIEKPQIGSAHFVKNAGIVLLHPFFQPFFQALDLMKDRKTFKNEKARHRAIHLLEYLATKSEQLPEYKLVLPKHLCGLFLEVPVERNIKLKKEEKEEVEKLLSAVIEHWDALKATSPDGLRQGFLQRDGKLELRESGWYLMVERKTIDILINRMPWGINNIHLPWMPELLKVEWNY